MINTYVNDGKVSKFSAFCHISPTPMIDDISYYRDQPLRLELQKGPNSDNYFYFISTSVSNIGVKKKMHTNILIYSCVFSRKDIH